MEKQIFFRGVDQGLENLMTRLRRQSTELGKQLLRDTVDQGKGIRDVNKLLEDQIKTLERKLKVESETRRIVETKRKEEAILNAPNAQQVDQINRGYERKIENIGKQEKEGELQVKLLRELIDTIKETARVELSEDRKGVERQIKAYEKGDLKNLSEDDEAKLLYQRSLINEGKFGKGGATGKEVFWGTLAGTAVGNFISKIPDRAANIATQSNIYSMFSKGIALIPSVGAALSSLGDKALSEASTYQQSMGKVASIRGGHFRSYRGMGRHVEPMGYSMNDYLGALGDVSLAAGGTMSRKEETQQATTMLGLERGFSLDRGAMAETLRLGRRGGADLVGTTDLLVKMGNRGGLLGFKGEASGDNMALLGELLQINNEIGREQLQILGHVDTGVNVGMMSELMGLSESFHDPEILKTVRTRIQGGLSGSSTPQVEAIQFAALSRIAPGASLWEMEKIKEQGMFGVDKKSGKSYLGSYLETLRKASPNDEEFFRNIKGTFGLSANLSQQLGEGFIKGGMSFNPDEWKAKIEGETKGMTAGGITTRAIDATGEIAQSTVGVTNVWADAGDRLVENAAKVVAAVTGVIEGIKQLVEETQELKKENIKIAESMMESSSALTRIAGTTMYTNQYLPPQF